MFQFRRFPSYSYVFTVRWQDMTPAGLLHSEIHGSKSAYDSPWHIAVSCVLLRLSVPRHSPCALCSLTMWLSWFFLNMKIVVILPLYLSIQVNFRSFFKLLLLLFDFFIQFSKCEWICSICFNSLLVGLSGLEPPTSRLSGVCSNLLSYKPIWFFVASSLPLSLWWR